MVLNDLEMIETIEHEETWMQTMASWAFKKIKNSTIQSILIYQAKAKLLLGKCFFKTGN